jgi:sugar lactone lactonase YvrE
VLLVACFCAAAPFAAADEPKFLTAWGKKGDRPGEFYSPIVLAMTPKDELYVADNNNARIQKFDTDGKYLSGFDLPLDKPPRKSCLVSGMALDKSGNLYVSFMIQHKLVVYTDSGELVREWGKLGKEDGEFHQPGGIVIDSEGRVTVADQCNHRVQRFTADGMFVMKWGEHGSEAGQFGGLEPAGSRFGGPHFLATDRQGRYYTTEGVLGRIQQFSQDGKALLAWGDKSDQHGGFGSYTFGSLKNTFGPIGVAVDRHDRIWVSSLNDRVQCFTADGKLLFGLGGSGSEPGEFTHPHGMAFDSHDHLYVADSGNQRIQKFQVPQP